MTKPSKYQDALDYLYSFIDYSLTRQLRYSPEKFNLARMSRFLELIGNPQNNFNSIHVAGTKGKGSICAMLNSILMCAGYKTGFYSSPHMVDFNERIRVGNTLISHAEIVAYVDQSKPFISLVEHLTTFEISTALAFKFFSDKKVDFAMIEVGLGGRFDATNVITPLVSVISTISFDHTAILGNTLSKIAFEKAGIIKMGVPVVSSPQKKTALKVIQRIAEEKDAPLIDAQKQFPLMAFSENLERQRFSINSGSNPIKLINLPLLGAHQLENAGTAFAVIQELRKQGFEISDQAVRDGFANVQWPGRFEVIQREPLMIIDGAHNPESFRRLAETIKHLLPDRKVVFVFGVSEDKNVKSMLKIIQPLVEHLIITQSEHPRALGIYEIQAIANLLEIPNAAYSEVGQARDAAERFAGKNGVIIAAGSIFIAGAFRQMVATHV